MCPPLFGPRPVYGAGDRNIELATHSLTLQDEEKGANARSKSANSTSSCPPSKRGRGHHSGPFLLKRSRMVGPGRLELPTSRLSGVHSNHLSYEPNRKRNRTGRIEMSR